MRPEVLKQKTHYETIHDKYEAYYFDSESMAFREKFVYDVMFDGVHAQGGLTGYAHEAWAGHYYRQTQPSRYLYPTWDPTINLIRGKVDFLELLQFRRLGLDDFYDFLNLGVKLIASSGSDLPWGNTIGETRVYAYTGPHFSVDAWFDAFKRGRTFVTTHYWQLIVVPIVLIATFTYAFLYFNAPVSQLPVISSLGMRRNLPGSSSRLRNSSSGLRRTCCLSLSSLPLAVRVSTQESPKRARYFFSAWFLIILSLTSAQRSPSERTLWSVRARKW